MRFFRQPFQDDVDVTFFFSGGSRKEIVEEINRSLVQQVPLITMTGEEGSGKTMICRMLETDLPGGIRSLYLSPSQGSFDDMLGLGSANVADIPLDDDDSVTETILDDLVMPRTLESFDDMVSIIFEHVVCEEDDYREESDTESMLSDVVSSLKARGQRLLIIFDEAEKIYLAPLERLRRMLDKINEESVVVQLLFSGRPLLAEHFEQLNIVAFKEIDERHFVLPSLDRESTQAYLKHCMKVGTLQESDFFTRESIDMIFSIAKGNFAKINRLARENLKAEKLDTTFLKLIDKGQDIEIEPVGERPRGSRVSSGMPKVDLDFLKLPSFRPQWLLYGGGFCTVVLLVLLLMGRSGDDYDGEQKSPDVPDLELKNVEPLDSEVAALPPIQPDKELDRPELEAGAIESEVERVAELPPGGVFPKDPAAEPKIQRQADLNPSADTAPAETQTAVVTTVIKPADDQSGQPAQPEKEETVSIRQQVPEASTPTVAAEKEPAIAIGPVEEKPALTEDRVTEGAPDSRTVPVNTSEQPVTNAKIVVKPLREKKEVQQPGAVRILESRDKKIPVGTAPAEELEPAGGGAEDMSVDEIYQERLAAGARWMVGKNKDLYTVQLMLLASDQAEKNLKEMLDSQDYRSVADKLFILRRLGSPPTVKLFYGEYETFGAARKARNTLPLFFREYQPFAVTVNDAVEGLGTVP